MCWERHPAKGFGIAEGPRICWALLALPRMQRPDSSLSGPFVFEASNLEGCSNKSPGQRADLLLLVIKTVNFYTQCCLAVMQTHCVQSTHLGPSAKGLGWDGELSLTRSSYLRHM